MQLLRRIRIFGLMLLFLLVASTSYAQSSRLSIDRKSSTIDAILDDIEKHTDYLFIYRKGVNVMLKRSISAKDKPVSEILKTLFEGTGITYTMEGNYIVLTQAAVKAPVLSVSGIVTDDDGIPLIGVVVAAKRADSYALTDSMGKFVIELSRRDELQFSSMGYQRYDIEVVPGQVLSVVMEEKIEEMAETVAIGFGVQRKSDVTGAITSIDSKSIENKSVNSLPAAIIGVAAGIRVISTSGRPSAIGDIRIRGISSNSSSANNPLYIVDGLQVKTLKYVNPNNIESIEILKDAASAAIYGAQAGNGVVVITTKTGKEGSSRVFYNGSYRFESAGWRTKMMNAEQFIDFNTSAGLMTPGMIMENWDKVTDTDWQSEMFPGGYAVQHNIGLEGGNDKSQFFTSITYLDNDGIVYGDKDRLHRINFQINASYQVKDWIKIGTTNSLQYKLTSVENGSMDGSETSPMSYTYAMSPLMPLTYTAEKLPDTMRSYLDNGKRLLRLPSGEYISTTHFATSVVNPLIDLYRHPESVNEDLDFYGTMYLDITPSRFLKFTSRFGYLIENADDYKYEEPWYADEQVYESEYKLYEKVEWKMRYQWDNFVNFDTRIGSGHNLSFMAGMSYIEENGRYATGQTNELKDYLPNFRHLSFSTSSAIDEVDGMRSKQSSLSYFSRISYNYASRYYLQTSFRADAFDTSRLSKKNRWGYFPSISAGWTMTNEPWMDTLDRTKLSFLKLRACWGVNGNIGVLSGYPYAATVTIGGSQYQLGPDGSLTLASYPSRLANEDLKWEESRQLDIGIDARLFSNRLSITFDNYYKRTDNLLVSVTPSYMTGQSSVYMNAGSVGNHGFELELSWKDSIGNLIYGISGNLSRNKNIVQDLASSVTRISGASVDNGHHATLFQKGYPIWYMYGYEYEGVDPKTGNNLFRDVDGDGRISTGDMTMIGCAQPDFTYGISLNAEYKGFDAVISGYGSYGNDIWFAGFRPNSICNVPAIFYLESWKHPGDVTRYPRPSQMMTSSYVRSSACVYDGSYFRLSQVQLGYSLPSRFTDRINAEVIRFYVSFDDCLTLSRYPGYDPVTAGDNSSSAVGIDRGSYPTPRKITLGVNLSF